MTCQPVICALAIAAGFVPIWGAFCIAGEAPEAPARAKPDELVNSIGVRLILIPAGEFVMGSPATEDGRTYGQTKETLHRVKITKQFRMGATEVTQAQWKAIMQENPSTFMDDDFPVDNVSWDDAVAFCEKLGKKEGKHYRLPTEAEWEYACRAGTTTAYATGNSDASLARSGWFNENSERATHAVAGKLPNKWGLYDMHGNLWEWCSDLHGEPGVGDATDPTGPAEGTYRVIRGGSWNSPSEGCRSACSLYNAPFGGGNIFGLRVVLDVE